MLLTSEFSGILSSPERLPWKNSMCPVHDAHDQVGAFVMMRVRPHSSHLCAPSPGNHNRTSGRKRNGIPWAWPALRFCLLSGELNLLYIPSNALKTSPEYFNSLLLYSCTTVWYSRKVKRRREFPKSQYGEEFWSSRMSFPQQAGPIRIRALSGSPLFTYSQA